LALLKKRLNPVAWALPLDGVIAPRGVVAAAAAAIEEVGLTATDFLNEVRTDRRSGSLAVRAIWAGDTSTEGELRIVPELSEAAPLLSKRICRCSPTEHAVVVLCCFCCASSANRGPASESMRR
jgi:hypothetical protein